MAEKKGKTYQRTDQKWKIKFRNEMEVNGSKDQAWILI